MTPSLLSHLAAATAGSAELDREVLLACGWGVTLDTLGVRTWKRADGKVWGDRAPRPTRSLDDIDAMIHEAGMEWYRFRLPTGARMVVESAEDECWSDHADRSVALCIAFLRAMEAGR